MRPLAIAELDEFRVSSLTKFNSARNQDAPQLGAGEIRIESSTTMRSQIARRKFLNALGAANAVKQIGRLPEADEQIHCVMRGNFPFYALVRAVLSLAAPATITELWIATLGTNQKNTADLCELIDNQKVGRAHVLVSCYLRDASNSIYSHLLSELATKRSQRVAASRNHAKIQLFKMSDGRHFTAEGSANLRSCNNIEQFVLTSSAAVFDFHSRWIDEIIRGAA